ncbi:hypothetical protein D3C72_1735110 [compost metagenome]
MLVEDQSFALAAAVDTHMEALDYRPRALLEHAPGLHRPREKLHQVEAWMLPSVALNADVSATT